MIRLVNTPSCVPASSVVTTLLVAFTANSGEVPPDGSVALHHTEYVALGKIPSSRTTKAEDPTVSEEKSAEAKGLASRN